MTEKLNAAIGQSLLAIGLYTVAFESMVLSFRAQMQGYLLASDQGSLRSFEKACITADKTFTFCAPKMLALGIVDTSDMDALKTMRQRRNYFAHQGYNEMMSLTVENVENDVQLIYRITSKVERWEQAHPVAREGQAIPFSISPCIIGLYLQVAQEIARTKLAVEGDSPSAT